VIDLAGGSLVDACGFKSLASVNHNITQGA